MPKLSSLHFEVLVITFEVIALLSALAGKNITVDCDSVLMAPVHPFIKEMCVFHSLCVYVQSKGTCSKNQHRRAESFQAEKYVCPVMQR